MRISKYFFYEKILLSKTSIEFSLLSYCKWEYLSVDFILPCPKKSCICLKLIFLDANKLPTLCLRSCNLIFFKAFPIANCWNLLVKWSGEDNVYCTATKNYIKRGNISADTTNVILTDSFILGYLIRDGLNLPVISFQNISNS